MSRQDKQYKYNPGGFINLETGIAVTWDTIRKQLASNKITLQQARQKWRFPKDFTIGDRQLKRFLGTRITRERPPIPTQLPEEEAIARITRAIRNYRAKREAQRTNLYNYEMLFKVKYSTGVKEYPIVVNDVITEPSFTFLYILDLIVTIRPDTSADVEFVKVISKTRVLYSADIRILYSDEMNDDDKKRYTEMMKQSMREFSFLRYSNLSTYNFQPNSEGKCVQEYLKLKYPKTIDIDGLFPEVGITTEQIVERLCEKYHISIYVLDLWLNIVFHKSFDSNMMKHYKPLMYICANNHMYPIENKQLRKSIQSKSTSTTRGVLNNDDVIPKSVSNLEELENIQTIEEVVSLSNTIVYYDNNLIITALFKEALRNKIVWNPIFTERQLTKIIIKNQNVILMVSPYYKEIKKVCVLHNIEYKAQPLSTLSGQLFELYHKSKLIQRDVSNELKQEIRNNCKDRCKNCKVQLNQDEGHIDHIDPLYKDGINAIKNLQLLCLDCHQKKALEDRFTQYDHSSFSSELRELFIERNLKQPIIYRENKIDIQKTYTSKYDIKKCYRNCLMEGPKYGYPIYTVRDESTVYNGEPLQAGFYYVETHNHIPMRGNGWYIADVIEYCREMGVEMKITHHIKPSYVLDRTFFVPWVKWILETVKDEQTGKHIINLFIGNMGRRYKKNEKHIFMTNLIGIPSKWIAYKYGTDENIYDVMKLEKTEVYTSMVPFYNCVLDLSNIKLHRLMKLVCVEGTSFLGVETDAVIIQYDKRPEIQNEEWFKLEWEKKTCILDLEYIKKWKGVVENTLEKYGIGTGAWVKQVNQSRYNQQIKQYNEIKTENQTEIQRIFIDGHKSLMINGGPGSGKSYLIKLIMGELKNKCIQVAPTWKASRLIDGVSIYSLFQQIKNKGKPLKGITTIIIDECSMLNTKYYEMLLRLKRQNSNLKFFIVGDFDQIPAVKEEHLNWKVSLALGELCDWNRVELITNYRIRDKKLMDDIQLLKSHNEIYIEPYFSEKKTERHLCRTNKMRIKINSELNELNCPKRHRKTKIGLIYTGLPLLCIKNNHELEIYNSERFFVKKVSCDSNETRYKNTKQENRNGYQVIIYKEGTDIEINIEYDILEQYFDLGYCSTVEKSQGETINEKYTIHEWNRMSFNHKYVVLSRAREKKQIHISIK